MLYSVDTLVISDIHLGDGSGSDDFGYARYKRLQRQQDVLIDNIKKINAYHLILAGDIFANWQHQLSKIVKLYKKLIDFFKSFAKLTVCKGNHDEPSIFTKKDTIAMDDIFDWVDHVILQLPDGKTAYVSHGHQMDVGVTTFWGKVGLWFMGWIEKAFPGLDNGFVDERKGNVYKYALDYGMDMTLEHDFVIFGHSHIHEQVHGYFNCGTCQGGKFQGVTINGSEVKLVSAA